MFFFFFSLENNNQLLISWHNENGHTGELSLEWLKQNSYSVMAQEHRNQQMVTQPYVGKVNGMIGQFGGLIVTLKITSLLLKSPEHYKSFTAGFQIVFFKLSLWLKWISTGPTPDLLEKERIYNEVQRHVGQSQWACMESTNWIPA